MIPMTFSPMALWLDNCYTFMSIALIVTKVKSCYRQMDNKATK